MVDSAEDTDALQVMERARAQVKRETEAAAAAAALATREAALTAREQAIHAAQRAQAAETLAAELHVDAAALLKYTDGTEAAMRDFAKLLPQKPAPPAPGAETLRPDSGRGEGGGRTDTQIMDAYLGNPTPENRKAYEGVRQRKGW